MQEFALTAALFQRKSNLTQSVPLKVPIQIHHVLTKYGDNIVFVFFERVQICYSRESLYNQTQINQ